MSRSQKNLETNDAPKFNAKPYVRPGLSESDIQEIKDHFDIFDREHIGSINPKGTLSVMAEIKSALSSLGIEARAHGVYQVILDMDGEGAGNITFEQFIHLMTPRLIPEDSRENIDSIFTLFDDEKTGFISLAGLRRAVH